MPEQAGRTLMIELERAPSDGIVPGYAWTEGDGIAAIGSTPLRDILDFYYLGEEEGVVDVVFVSPDGTHRSYPVQTSELSILAESFRPMEFKTCAARCIFCFIDQNPPGMRDNIYVKDEDYRFSFLYGNYITLTSMNRKGLERIIEQRLSPLYVSVHATEIETRTELLGIKRRIDVMETLRHLTSHGIEVHAQIVLCPGFNDGDVLDRSLRDLATLGELLRSISVVPVGLSDHREGLPQLTAVTRDDASRAIDQIEAHAERFLADRGSRLAFASDEFYLLDGRIFPPLEFYEELLQQDTGIGGCRSIIDEIELVVDEIADLDRPTAQVTVLTGTLAARFMERDLRKSLSKVAWLDLRVVPIENSLYGQGITVAGLLAGKDFLDALEQLPPDCGQVWLPDVAINHDGLFLDDMSLDELRRRSPVPFDTSDGDLASVLSTVASEGAR
jgi:putative radical SAM enzyme (TIGR03279 family)